MASNNRADPPVDPLLEALGRQQDGSVGPQGPLIGDE